MQPISERAILRYAEANNDYVKNKKRHYYGKRYNRGESTPSTVVDESVPGAEKNEERLALHGAQNIGKHILAESRKRERTVKQTTFFNNPS